MQLKSIELIALNENQIFFILLQQLELGFDQGFFEKSSNFFRSIQKSVQIWLHSKFDLKKCSNWIEFKVRSKKVFKLDRI